MAKQIAKTSCNSRSPPQKTPTPEHLQGLVGAVLSTHKPKAKPRGEKGPHLPARNTRAAACGEALGRGRMSSGPSGQWGSCRPLDPALHQSLNWSYGFLKPLWTRSCSSHTPSFCCYLPHAAVHDQPTHIPIPELCSPQSSPCSSLSTSSAPPGFSVSPAGSSGLMALHHPHPQDTLQDNLGKGFVQQGSLIWGALLAP